MAWGIARLPVFLITVLAAAVLGIVPAAAAPPPSTTCSVFPSNNIWNTDISKLPVHARSTQWLASMAASTTKLHPDFGGPPYGFPYNVVGNAHPTVTVSFQYASESDPGPYPIPPNVPIEGGSASTGDRHVIVVDVDAWKLYELFDARPVNGGASWTAGSGAVFDLATGALRPDGWTSADAAGLPIFAGLARYDEVVTTGVITHALRFTCPVTRRAYVPPARHEAGSTNFMYAPPMGMRVRLKASVDISGYPAEDRVILQALKTYGMYVADNGGPFFLSGAPDPRWNDANIDQLKQIHGSDFEVVRMTGVVVP